MTTREDVFVAISDEREYQKYNANNGNGWDDSRNNVADYILYIERYLNYAKNMNEPTDNTRSLEQLVKVAALAVAALEQFGIPYEYVR